MPAQLSTQFFERGIGLLVNQGTQLFHVLNQLDRLAWTWFPGGDLTRLATTLLQPPYPSLTDLVLCCNGRRPHPRIAIFQNTFTQIHRIRIHGNSFLERLQFRLFANPTKRLCAKSLGRDGQPIAKKWEGKRVPIPQEKLVEWLARQGEHAGFSFTEKDISAQAGYVYVQKGGNAPGQRLSSARFDGVLAASGSLDTANSWEKQGFLEQGSVKYSFVVDGGQMDDAARASLQIVAIAWPYLGQKDQQEILAIVRRASDNKKAPTE